MHGHAAGHQRPAGAHDDHAGPYAGHAGTDEGHGRRLSWLIPLTLVVWLLARIKRGHQRVSQKTPLVILEERYARGEIEQEEYRSRRADLLKYDDGAYT